MVVVSPTFTPPVEGILFHAATTKLIVNEKELGTGNLYITEKDVVWGGGVSPAGTPVSNISLLYPTIALHAIQREPLTALFMVLNYELSLPELTSASGGGDMNDDDEDEEFDANNQPITELRFVPQNETDLEGMYSAMSQGQALHPDNADDECEDMYMDGEDYYEGEDQFEDAEESGADMNEATSRMHQLRVQPNGCKSPEEEFEDADVAEE